MSDKQKKNGRDEHVDVFKDIQKTWEHSEKEPDTRSPLADLTIRFLLFFISIIIPFLGFALFALFREEKPKDARWCLIGALSSVLLALALQIWSWQLQGPLW